MASYKQLSSAQEIASQLKEFQKRIKTLGQMKEQLGGPNDKKSFRQKLVQEKEQTQKLIKDIIAQFDEKAENATEKSQKKKLSGNFKDLLMDYKKLSEQILEKERQIIDFIDDTMQSESYRRSGEMTQEQRQTFDLQELGAFSENALKERHEEVKALNNDMHVINELFKDVDFKVKEQQKGLDAAEAHVEVAVEETGQGVKEIEQADTYQQSTSKKMKIALWVIIVLVIIVICIVVGVTV